eukprot:gene791-842_t
MVDWIAGRLGGSDLLEDPFEWKPTEATDAKLKEVFSGIPLPIVDHHCHAAGMQEECSGCYVHPNLNKFFTHPVSYFQKKAFISALGGGHVAESCPSLDWEVAKRHARLAKHLAHLINTYRGTTGDNLKILLLPFDCVVDTEGNEDRSKTGLHVPQEYVEKVAGLAPEIFVPACSIHPYRKDCVERLRACHAKGCRVVKWLPNSMRIDAANPLCDRFYQEVKRLDMTILSHTGSERSVTGGGNDQEMGNPLRLRRPLSQGVRILAAHCASDGSFSDLDKAPHLNITKPPRPDVEKIVEEESVACPVCVPALPQAEGFPLLKRLFDEPKYNGFIFTDISAVEAFRRVDTCQKVLSDPDLLNRSVLLHGTDYPVPALNIVVHTGQLVRLKLITKAERKVADECYHANPMLFALVTKRLVAVREGESVVGKFPATVFGPHDKVKIGHFDYKEQNQV